MAMTALPESRKRRSHTDHQQRKSAPHGMKRRFCLVLLVAFIVHIALARFFSHADHRARLTSPWIEHMRQHEDAFAGRLRGATLNNTGIATLNGQQRDHTPTDHEGQSGEPVTDDAGRKDARGDDSTGDTDGKTVPIPSYIYFAEITLVVVLSLLFEMGQEFIRERAVHEQEVIEALFKELTILGFVGLLVYIVCKSSGAKTLAEYLIPMFRGMGQNPLQESFEMIHMVIFCLMMVFIFQALSLIFVSNDLTAWWNRWENIAAKGPGVSIEAQFKEYGYLDKDGHMRKPYQVPGVFHRMFIQDDIHAMLQWRALRHEFLFPTRGDAHQLSQVVCVSEPASFDFEMYLSKMLQRVFIELVEVDMITWIFALLCINPLVYFAQTLNTQDVCILQAVVAWSLFGGTVFILNDLTRIVTILTPELSEDPEKIIRYFFGTSQASLRRTQQRRGTFSTTSSAVASGGSDGNTEPLLRSSVQFVPPLHQPNAKLPQRTRLYMPFVGGRVAHMPSLQARLFFFQEKGIEVYASVLEITVFSQAVLVATLVLMLFVQPVVNGYQMVMIVAAWAEWPLMLFFLLPRVISRFCIVQSVENEKNKCVIEDVIFKVKHERVREAFRVLKLVKLRGRAKKLGGATISQAEFNKAIEKFRRMPKEEQSLYTTIFASFDADGSGYIDAEELSDVLEALGIVQGSDASVVALELVNMCDLSGTKNLTLEEFTVLMTLSMEKRTPKEEKADIKAFFQQIDQDESGSVTIEEIHNVFFHELKCDLSTEFIQTLVQRCFKVAKSELNQKEFCIWLRHLEGEQREHEHARRGTHGEYEADDDHEEAMHAAGSGDGKLSFEE